MAILFNGIVFGPIKSRRFGLSLGINLLPIRNKVCNFNCIYCECGWTDLSKEKIVYFDFNHIIQAIENKFQECFLKKVSIDSVTFAGNGEPTMHPDFLRIVEATVELRNKYFQGVSIAILSNAALLGNKKVIKALLLADRRVMKLDAGSNQLLNEINMPLTKKEIKWYVDKLKLFNGNVSIQTIFLKGNYNNRYIDNTTACEIDLWLKALLEIGPKEVMIYTLDRETPAKDLEKVSPERLNEICELVIKKGINATVYL